jgi:glycosyltransferase involved in cell wall biosynthesis
MERISVITICFNNLADVQRTCASVDAQTVLPDEHWIINGSTQPDIENWLLHTPQPSYRKWINERDKGIADAFNKGVQRAADGNITHLLNSGDIYAGADVLEVVLQVFNTYPETQWISGNIELMRGGHTVVVGKPFDKNKVYRGMRSISHPTWFLRKEVYGRTGGFNSNYRIAMDYDLMCRLINEPYRYLDKTLAKFDDTGISSIQYIASLRESRQVYESHFGFSFLLVIWQLRLQLLHYLLQTALGKWLFSLKKKLGLENM